MTVGNSEGSDSGAGTENIFAMDPQATVWTLARALVDGQRTLALLRAGADVADQAAAVAPDQANKVRADFRDVEKQWYGETLPTLAASFQLALEVFDTFGPEPTRITDPTDAAIWNNKHHVWVKELGGKNIGGH